jgi:hypothetical protein
MTKIIKKELSKEENKMDQKSNPFKSDLYSWNPTKKERGSIRRKRDSLIKGIMDSHQNKDLDKRNDLIKEFKGFYKKNYLRNDYSFESLSYKNIKESGRELIGDFLSHIKRWKIK